MSGPVTRRAALRGSAAAALGLAAGVAPALAVDTADATLIVQADAFRSLCARENQAWNDLDDTDDEFGKAPALTACRALSQACRDAGEALAAVPALTLEGLAAKASALLGLIGSHLDTQANLSEHSDLVGSIIKDAARLRGGAHA